VADAYDCVLIDTQGAIGPCRTRPSWRRHPRLADTPRSLGAGVQDGTMELLDRLEPGSALGATLGPVRR